MNLAVACMEQPLGHPLTKTAAESCYLRCTGWTLTNKTELGLKTAIFCPDKPRYIGWSIRTNTMIGIPFRIPTVTDKYGMMFF